MGYKSYEGSENMNTSSKLLRKNQEKFHCISGHQCSWDPSVIQAFPAPDCSRYWVSIAFWLTPYVLDELCVWLFDLFMSWELDGSEDCILIITSTSPPLPQLGAWRWLSICSKCSVNTKRVGLLCLLYKVGKQWEHDWRVRAWTRSWSTWNLNQIWPLAFRQWAWDHFGSHIFWLERR